MAASPSLKDAEASVDATCRLAIERVDTETPGASLLMNFLSFFEASAIPLEVLEQPPEIYPEVLRSTLSDPIVRDEAVSAVVDVSLADGRMQDYLQKKRTLAFDFVRRGDRAGAAAVQLELCREIRGSVGLNGVTSADLERELRNYGGMATDAGEKSWVIKANFREIGYRCQPAFKVGDLIDGITIVESVFGLSRDEVMRTMAELSETSPPDPTAFLDSVAEALTEKGAVTFPVQSLVIALSQRMEVKYVPPLLVWRGLGVIDSDEALSTLCPIRADVGYQQV